VSNRQEALGPMDQAEAVRQLLHYGLSSTELLARAAQRRRAVDERHPGTLGVGAADDQWWITHRSLARSLPLRSPTNGTFPLT
jgi:hypothetical protein